MSVDDLLNPLSPRNPRQQVTEANKVGNKDEDNTYHENQEEVFLPSKGLFYLGELEGKEYIKVRPLDYTDEDMLTTESYFTNNTIFEEILTNTILEKKIKGKSLVAVDRDTILLWLRATAFGPEFEINFTCPECGGGDGNKEKKGPGLLKWNLTEIDIPSYPDEVYAELIKEKGIIITTPYKQIRVKITVPTIGRQNSFDKRFKEKKIREEQTKDFYATTALLSVISGVEVEPDRFSYDTEEIVKFFNKIKLPLSDSRYILKKAQELVLKYDTKKDFKCKTCGHITEGVELPMLHRNFFWPEF